MFRMTMTRVSKLMIPAGHFVEHARALQCSRNLRERLHAAPAVVALWPNGSQQVVWGHDYLKRWRVLGHATAKVLLLRVSDEEDCIYLNSAVLALKEQDAHSLKARQSAVSGKEKRASPWSGNCTGPDAAWRMA
jgi:hypothetical protein